MKSILSAFIEAGPRERLAILADVLSVVGISLLAAISPIIAGISRKTLWAYVASGCIVFGVIAGLAVLMAGASRLSSWYRARYKGPAVARPIVVAIWSIYIIMVLLAGYIVVTKVWDYFASVT